MSMWPFRYPHWSRYGRNLTLRWPGSRNTWPVLFIFSLAHWTGAPGGGCSHGRRSTVWPWWKLGSALFCNLGRRDAQPFGVEPPSSGVRLWLYTRRGACCIDVYVDRRPLTMNQRAGQGR